MISIIQHFEADFLWKVSLKILNSGIILKTFFHVSTINKKTINQPLMAPELTPLKFWPAIFEHRFVLRLCETHAKW